MVAVIIAVVLIGGAYAWRNRDDGGLSISSGSRTVVCITELADVCNAIKGDDDDLTVTIEDGGITADRLIAAGDAEAAGLDGWLTAPAWIDIVRDERKRASRSELFDAPGQPVARTTLVAVAASTRMDALRSSCSGVVGWKCLGDVMNKGQWSAVPGGNQTWGAVKVSWADPVSSTAGLLTLGATAKGYFGRDFDTLDLDDAAFGSWLTGVARTTAGSTPNALNNLLVTGPASYGWVITTEATTEVTLQSAARASEFASERPFASTFFEAVFGALGDQGSLERKFGSGDAKEAFEKAGWSTEALPRNPVTSSNGLPSSGSLAAVRNKWKQELSR
jgi:hypothetical protein